MSDLTDWLNDDEEEYEENCRTEEYFKDKTDEEIVEEFALDMQATAMTSAVKDVADTTEKTEYPSDTFTKKFAKSINVPLSTTSRYRKALKAGMNHIRMFSAKEIRNEEDFIRTVLYGPTWVSPMFAKTCSFPHDSPMREYNERLRKLGIQLGMASAREREHLELCPSCRYWSYWVNVWLTVFEGRPTVFAWSAWEASPEAQRAVMGYRCYKACMETTTIMFNPPQFNLSKYCKPFKDAMEKVGGTFKTRKEKERFVWNRLTKVQRKYIKQQKEKLVEQRKNLWAKTNRYLKKFLSYERYRRKYLYRTYFPWSTIVNAVTAARRVFHLPFTQTSTEWMNNLSESQKAYLNDMSAISRFIVRRYRTESRIILREVFGVEMNNKFHPSATNLWIDVRKLAEMTLKKPEYNLWQEYIGFTQARSKNLLNMVKAIAGSNDGTLKEKYLNQESLEKKIEFLDSMMDRHELKVTFDVRAYTGKREIQKDPCLQHDQEEVKREFDTKFMVKGDDGRLEEFTFEEEKSNLDNLGDLPKRLGQEFIDSDSECPMFPLAAMEILTRRIPVLTQLPEELRNTFIAQYDVFQKQPVSARQQRELADRLEKEMNEGFIQRFLTPQQMEYLCQFKKPVKRKTNPTSADEEETHHIQKKTK